MQYRLYKNSHNNVNNVIETVLSNRGINDINRYLNLDESVVLNGFNLNNMELALYTCMKHIANNDIISILVDEDVDGFCSAAMMYMYIKDMNKKYPVNYILHTNPKTHGLEYINDIPENTKLLIIPDAGTNDTEACKKISEQGIDIIILDHHEKEEENPYAIIVNNQMSDKYENKELCGAGIVYKFIKELDDWNWQEFADKYLDLCALANISDVMDLRSFETKYFVEQGLANIQNKFFEALINAQSYSMGGKITIHNISWYITSVINGMIRYGSYDEKELMFKAFIEQDEYFTYNKKATKNGPAETIQESIYDRAARLCKNAKSRQDKAREKATNEIIKIIDDRKSGNKVIVEDVTGIMSPSQSGVVAIKIAEKYKMPCILQTKRNDKKNVYSGSARNFNHSPIANFKDIVNESGVFDFGKGHASAFGVELSGENAIVNAIHKLDSMLEDVIYDDTYFVDFILDVDDVTIGLITELDKLNGIICHGFDQPAIAIENIQQDKDQIEILGKNMDTISFTINDIKYIKFKCKDNDPLYEIAGGWSKFEDIIFNIIGTPVINEYNGVRTPQIIINDMITINNKKYECEDSIWDE